MKSFVKAGASLPNGFGYSLSVNSGVSKAMAVALRVLAGRADICTLQLSIDFTFDYFKHDGGWTDGILPAK